MIIIAAVIVSSPLWLIASFLKDITKNIINSNFTKNDYFNFSITKKTKSSNV
jgi:hypothetical protein